MCERKLKYLVADTTAFINNVQLQEYAENVCTVPDVVNEVKNKRQIKRLVVLPFELKVQEPDVGCLRYVTNFAKKTGDYASLSSIDLKVIALTYELEKKHVGDEHLRSEPIVPQVVASKSKPVEFADKNSMIGFYNPKICNKKDCDASSTCGNSEHNEGEEQVNTGKGSEDTQDEVVTEDGGCENGNGCLDLILADHFGKLSTETDNVNPEEILVPQSCESDDDYSEESEELEDDDTSWITPSNINKVRQEFQGEAEETEVVVACMSTDYAIQNVLKQINLNVVALDGKVIRHVKTYILRCYACFRKTSVMTKVFCPYCGNKTLKRVAVSLDENGQQVIHINTRRPLTSKFKNQSLPRPRGGKHSCNPILVEDQPIPKQMPSRVAKTKTNALDEDYIAGYSPFVMRDVDSKSALLRSKGNIKQWARNNLYEENRRKKQSNRLVK